MVAYAQQASECRRLPLARALGERLPPGACGTGMCDVCSGETRSQRVEVTGAVKALIALVRAAGAKSDKQGRITHRALAEAFVKGHKKRLAAAAAAAQGKGKGKGKGKGRKGKGDSDSDKEEEGEEEDVSGGVHLLAREAVERLVNQLCMGSVLGEDYHASMYTINAYVVVGYQASFVFCLLSFVFFSLSLLVPCGALSGLAPPSHGMRNTTDHHNRLRPSSAGSGACGWRLGATAPGSLRQQPPPPPSAPLRPRRRRRRGRWWWRLWRAMRRRTRRTSGSVVVVGRRMRRRRRRGRQWMGVTRRRRRAGRST